MAVWIPPVPSLPPVAGFRAAAVAAGIKESGAPDLLLVAMEAATRVAGVFTRNQAAAAPVLLDRERLPRGEARALLVNAGNANACTGAQGLADARHLTEKVAGILGVEAETVFVSSTGVIGKPLPVARMEAALPGLAAALTSGHWREAAGAIMTTDAFPKAVVRTLEIAGKPVTLVGIAKGAGMIHPDMATMLAYLFTDANVTAPALQTLLAEAVQESFNSISVDGDTSTNDTLMAFASCRAEHALVEDARSPEGAALLVAMAELCRELARFIVLDGEGATRLVEIVVAGAGTRQDARRLGRAIAVSPLVKTALHGGDPNWGRILSAAANAGVPLELARLRLFLGECQVVEGGMAVPGFSEEAAARAMAGREVFIRLDVGLGEASHTVWTCDFSAEYIRINADYRT